MSELTDDQFLGAAVPPAAPKELSDDDFFGGSQSASTQQSLTAPMSWSDAASSAAKNLGPSAMQFGSNMAQPFLHPIDTATSLGQLGKGVMQHLGVMSGVDQEKYADAVGQFLSNRYGSVQNIKNTLANDPVGLAGDLSMVLSGGGTGLARLPGIVGKVGEVTSAAGRLADPLSAVTGAAKVAGKVGSEAIGLTTGTGAQPLRTAAQVGYEGGEAAKAFQENMRGAAPMSDAVTEARDALTKIRAERGNAYNAQMAAVRADPTILDFGQIDKALNNIQSVKSFKGQSLSPTTEGIRQTLTDTVNDWRDLDPTEFHTAEGIDALKQKVGDIRDGTQYGTPERVVGNQVYSAVRNTIVNQVPEYAKVMKGYEDASNQIKEIERTLSLNPNASVDTTLRKLQSTLRDNVNTNFGQRKVLADYLVNAGAPNLINKLAGQSLSAWAPRGLGRLSAQLGLELGAAGIGAGVAGLHGAAAALPMLPLMSPRLMGEAAYYGGKTAGTVAPAMPYVRPAVAVARQFNQQNQQQPQFAKGGRVSGHNINHAPTEAQKAAGNYAKDHVNVHGLNITIENAKDSLRRGIGKDGKPWSVKMPAHYGYIKGTVGKDKDHVDVYLGPHLKAPNAFVVDQHDADSGKFDEHKVFLGFSSPMQVRKAYESAFSDGRGSDRLHSMLEMPIGEFKDWLKNGDTTKKIASPSSRKERANAVLARHGLPAL